MGNWDAVDQILDFVPTINFSNTSDEVSLFETTIRYLGGLVSGEFLAVFGPWAWDDGLTSSLIAYDLITGPLKDQVGSDKQAKVDAILTQAKNLANNLKVAFFTPSGVPDNGLFFNPPRIANDTTNGLATIGTLVLEWTRLSDLTGDPEYAALAQKAERYLLRPSPPSAEPFPGLIGTNVNITTGKFVDNYGGWVGGDDSFYEYLIKMFLYDPDRFDEYRQRWIAAVDSSIKFLASHPTTRPELTFLAYFDGTTPRFVSQHCKLRFTMFPPTRLSTLPFC
jgi:mannosyl-oligosaccharide alpha-1,2-mannosidase